MVKRPIGSKSIGTALAAASVAGIPLGGAAAQSAPEPASGTTVSVEGGVTFSNYWQTTFPNGAIGVLPAVYDPDKTGSPPVSSGTLNSKDNIGGYGSFSLARDVNASLDWRFSAAFYDFGTTSSSGSASQFFTGEYDSFTNTASATENDRFYFETFDFDFGRKWTQGLIAFRAFAGLRGLYENETFTTSLSTEGTDKVGYDPATFATTDTNIFANGKSRFFGAGPRVGIDFNTVSTWGLVGSVSGALIGGIRDGTYDTATNVSVDGGPPSAFTTSVSSNRADWVGNLEAMFGVAWQFSPQGQLVIGYKVDQWYNIRDNFNFAGFSNKQDILTQTPFLRVTLRY